MASKRENKSAGPAGSNKKRKPNKSPRPEKTKAKSKKKGSRKPNAAKSAAAKPNAAKPAAAKPDAAKPDAAKPDAAKPDAAKPGAAKPDAAKPGAAQPPPPPPPPAPGAAAEGLLREEEIERIRLERVMQAYEELGYAIVIDEPAPASEPAAPQPAPNPDPAVGGLAQELTPAQRAYRDELLGQLREVKARKAAHQAEKRRLQDQLEWQVAAIQACKEDYARIVAKLKAI